VVQRYVLSQQVSNIIKRVRRLDLSKVERSEMARLILLTYRKIKENEDGRS